MRVLLIPKFTTLLFNDPVPDIYSAQQQLSPLKICNLTQVRQDGKITHVCMCVCWWQKGWVYAWGPDIGTGGREERTGQFYHKNTILQK